MVLFILAVVWAIYLVSWLRNRTEERRTNSISSFSKHLSVLERATPGGRSAGLPPAVGVGTAVPGSLRGPVRRPSISAAKKRRRDILVGLLAATGVTFLATLVVGGFFTALFVLSLLLTGAYVALLVQAQKRVMERRAKVRSIANRPTLPAAWSQVEDGWYDDGYGDLGNVYAVNGR